MTFADMGFSPLATACLEISAAHTARCEVARIKRERAGTSVMDITLERIGHAAPRAIHGMVKTRARAIRRWPTQLDAIPGLSAASTPAQIIATCDAIEDAPARWFGNGGKVRPINLRAAKLYARWFRLWQRAVEREFLAARAEQAAALEAA